MASSPAAAALFNPAFMAALVASGTIGYQSVAGAGMPFELTFLVAPIALHDGTRSALPGNISGRMSTWVLAHPLFGAQFPDRARAMVPLVQEGLRYGLRASSLVAEGGRISANIPPRRLVSLGTPDVQACLRAAGFAGRWFARTGDPYTIFTLFGVRP